MSVTFFCLACIFSINLNIANLLDFRAYNIISARSFDFSGEKIMCNRTCMTLTSSALTPGRAIKRSACLTSMTIPLPTNTFELLSQTKTFTRTSHEKECRCVCVCARVYDQYQVQTSIDTWE